MGDPKTARTPIGMNSMSCLKHVRRFAAISPVAAALLFTSASFATTPTRSQYVEQVEPICKTGTLANRNVLKGVESMVRQGKLKLAAHRFLTAANALQQVIKRLTVVPRPPADVDRLSQWLGHAKAADSLLSRIGRSLKEGNRSKAQDMANELLTEAKRANAVVVGFDFDYCRLNPARFV